MMMDEDCSTSEMMIAPKKDMWFYTKLAFIILFIAGDIYLNSKAEYEALLQFDASKTTSHTNNTNEWAQLSQLQMLLFGCAIILQLSIASALFLILCNTFPFQVGLWYPFKAGVFKLFLILQPMYMILSCTVGGMRLVSKCKASQLLMDVSNENILLFATNILTESNLRGWKHRRLVKLVILNCVFIA